MIVDIGYSQLFVGVKPIVSKSLIMYIPRESQIIEGKSRFAYFMKKN